MLAETIFHVLYVVLAPYGDLSMFWGVIFYGLESFVGYVMVMAMLALQERWFVVRSDECLTGVLQSRRLSAQNLAKLTVI